MNAGSSQLHCCRHPTPSQPLPPRADRLPPPCHPATSRPQAAAPNHYESRTVHSERTGSRATARSCCIWRGGLPRRLRALCRRRRRHLTPPSGRPVRTTGPNPGGWGLRMVDEIADSWGTSTIGDHTTVWIELTLPSAGRWNRATTAPASDGLPRTRAQRKRRRQDGRASTVREQPGRGRTLLRGSGSEVRRRRSPAGWTPVTGGNVTAACRHGGQRPVGPAGERCS